MGGRGSGGHNKKTAEQHLREGTFRKDRHEKRPKAKRKVKVVSKRAVSKRPVIKKQEPVQQQAAMTPIKCPAWFDEYAKEEFERVCQVLYDKGMLADVNHATLEGYCSAYSRAVRAEIELRDGFDREVTMYGKGGDSFTVLKKKSECSVAERAWGQVKMFAVELGITSPGSPDSTDEKMTPLERELLKAERKPRNV